MEETGVLGLIEELAIMIEDAKPALGRNRLRQINADDALDLIDEIRELFPSEFAQSRQIVRERQALLDNAQDEADRILEDARNQAITIASEQEIVRTAQLQADTIMADARELEREIRLGAEDYADRVFETMENALGGALDNVRYCRDRLNASPYEEQNSYE